VPKYNASAALESLSTATCPNLLNGQLIYAMGSSRTMHIYIFFDESRSIGDRLFGFQYNVQPSSTTRSFARHGLQATQDRQTEMLPLSFWM
jgi:hypothetical protein